jgi:RNA polymerase-binding transcription factor
LVRLNAMEQQLLAEYKKRLEKERRLLLAEIAQNEKPADLGSDTEDPDEETDKSEELGNQLAVAQDLKYRLDEIDVALSKIQAGTYGVCEKCKSKIEKEILDIDPESRLCQNCKSGS